MDTHKVLLNLQAFLLTKIATCQTETGIPLQFVTLNREQTGMGAFGLLLSDSQRPGIGYYFETQDIIVQVVQCGDTLQVDNDKTEKIAAWLINRIRQWEEDYQQVWQINYNYAPRCAVVQNIDFGFVERIVTFSLWEVSPECYLT